jgi:hypothetical protein
LLLADSTGFGVFVRLNSTKAVDLRASVVVNTSLSDDPIIDFLNLPVSDYWLFVKISTVVDLGAKADTRLNTIGMSVVSSRAVILVATIIGLVFILITLAGLSINCWLLLRTNTVDIESSARRNIGPYCHSNYFCWRVVYDRHYIYNRL